MIDIELLLEHDHAALTTARASLTLWHHKQRNDSQRLHTSHSLSLAYLCQCCYIRVRGSLKFGLVSVRDSVNETMDGSFHVRI